MAITLPDFTALPQVTPQAGGSLMQYPQTDPVATGMGTLGKGLEAAGGAATDVAAYQDIAQTKMNRAMADADLSNRIIPITEQLKVETDPEKITALRGQFQDALNTASQAISNPDARAYWLNSHAATVATGQAEADLRSHALDADNYVAGVLKQGNDLVRNGATATDPNGIEIARHNIDQLTDTAVKGGYLTATKAQEYNTKLKSDLVTGRIDTLIARKQYDEAATLLDQNRNDIGPERAGTFEGRIAHAKDKQGNQSYTDGVWGSPDKGYGGIPPAGGGGAPDAGAVDAAQRMATVFKSRGWNDNAITGGLNNVMGESSFNPKSTGPGGEQGYFQFHPGSHLPLFTDQYKGDWSPEAQANYVADYVDKNMPGYKNSTDSAVATGDFLHGFEKPKDQSDAAVAARVGFTAATQRLLTGARQAAAAGTDVPPGTIDKTSDAGFGTKFGPLQSPQGMIIHHTAGGGSVDDVINTFKQTGYPAQFVIDRQGKIYQTLPDGYQGQHIRDSWGPLGAGKTNQNMEGVEIIANNDGDVLPVQQQAAARLVAARAAKFGYDPRTSVFGHGEVNPGHKEADEGMSTVTRIRNGSLPVTAPNVQVASATPTTMTDAQPGADAGRTRDTPLVEGGKTYSPGVMSPSELDAWHAAQGGNPIAIGDSIARGFQKSGGAAGTGKDLDSRDTTVAASGGRSPSTILTYLKKQPDGSLNGQPVVFSTGVSNGPAEANLVPQQLAELKRMGAGPISVVGVGTKAGTEGGNYYDLNQYNAPIEQAAKAAGATFLGGLPAVVHPATSYYAGAMPKAAASAAAAPPAGLTPGAAAGKLIPAPTGKPPTAPEGAIIQSPGKPTLQNIGGKWVPYLPEGL